MKKLVLGVVALCVALNSAWASCGWETSNYESCIKAYMDGIGHCTVDFKTAFKKEVTAEMVNRARLRLGACLAGQIR